jgi:hypothetical protein
MYAFDSVLSNNFQLLIDKNWFQKFAKSMRKITKKSIAFLNVQSPMIIIFKYYYCFLRDTSIPQFYGKTVFILCRRSIKIFGVGLNVPVRKARPYPKYNIHLLFKTR